MPPVRGRAAIRAAFVKDIADTAAAGIRLSPGNSPELGVSGDLGWEWNRFTVVDATGAVVDTGKYVTVYGRQGGTWRIVRDIWNSDTPTAAAEPGPEPEPETAAPLPGK
jgi:ketosteroid isomerase-like protein